MKMLLRLQSIAGVASAIAVLNSFNGASSSEICDKVLDLYGHCYAECARDPNYDPSQDDYYTNGGGSTTPPNTTTTTTTTKPGDTTIPPNNSSCPLIKSLYSHCFRQCAKNPNYDPSTDDFYNNNSGGGGGSSGGGNTTTTTRRPNTTTTTTTTHRPNTTTTTKKPSTGGGGGNCKCTVDGLVDSAPYTCNKQLAAQYCAAPWDNDGDDQCCTKPDFDAFALTAGCKCGSGGSSSGGGSTPNTTTTTTTHKPTTPTTTTTTKKPSTGGNSGSCSGGCFVSDLVDNAPWTCDKSNVKQFCAAPWDTDGDDECCSSSSFAAYAVSSGCKCP